MISKSRNELWHSVSEQRDYCRGAEPLTVISERVPKRTYVAIVDVAREGLFDISTPVRSMLFVDQIK